MNIYPHRRKIKPGRREKSKGRLSNGTVLCPAVAVILDESNGAGLKKTEKGLH
jgi:hypothetical protein